MQDAGARLMALPQLGVDVFGRGAPENLSARFRSVYGVTLSDLLRAYGDHRLREQGQTLRIAATDLYAVEDAIERLRSEEHTSQLQSLLRLPYAVLCLTNTSKTSYTN